jgi:hypothetical protein
MIRNHTAALCALALGAVFAIGGCGGGDDGGKQASGPKTSTETQPRRGFEAGTVGVVTPANFTAEVLESKQPVLVSIIGGDCCPTNNAYLRQLAAQRDDLRIVTLDIGKESNHRTQDEAANVRLAQRYATAAYSYQVLYKDGKKVTSIPGAMTEGHFKKKIEPNLH